MPTQFAETFAALSATFDPSEVKTRSQGGRQLSYITARTCANRLDDILGAENWRQEFTETKMGLKCRLWFRLIPDGEWSWKEDGGGFAGMSEGDNNEKSGYSDAFKRAAAMLGVGRYLYRDGVPHYGEVANESPATATRQPTAPSTPTGNSYRSAPESRPGQRRGNDGDGQKRDYGDKPPTSGRALFAWAKTQQEQHGKAGLIDDINGWGQSKRLPKRMVDWPEAAVADAYQEALLMIGNEPQPVSQAETEEDDGIPF